MQIDVYLETDPIKGCHAHALAFPGCFARGVSPSDALTNLRTALVDFQAWLARFEPASPLPADLDLVVAEEAVHPTGPFDPGDTAALFEAEKAPLGEVERERFLTLAAYNRADLLACAGELPDAVLDWEAPAFSGWPIRRILRHIGSGDQWYISRIITPEDYPAVWEKDSEMPVYAFLEMARRTTVELYRALPEGINAGEVRFPAHSTSRPEEPWTLRKALRRMLEHEREHTAQIRQVLARLADSRSLP